MGAYNMRLQPMVTSANVATAVYCRAAEIAPTNVLSIAGVHPLICLRRWISYCSPFQNTVGTITFRETYQPGSSTPRVSSVPQMRHSLAIDHSQHSANVPELDLPSSSCVALDPRANHRGRRDLSQNLLSDFPAGTFGGSGGNVAEL